MRVVFTGPPLVAPYATHYILCLLTVCHAMASSLFSSGSKSVASDSNCVAAIGKEAGQWTHHQVTRLWPDASTKITVNKQFILDMYLHSTPVQRMYIITMNCTHTDFSQGFRHIFPGFPGITSRLFYTSLQCSRLSVYVPIL
jgi:hypothetical protein